MASELKLRRGSNLAHTNFIGAQGEATFNTDTKTLHVHDGATAGGIPLARVSETGRVVDSIAALRLLDKARYTRAFVSGYHAQGDGGGGGAYWYDSTDTTSSDNGGTVIVATDGARWKLTDTNRISVRQFGAKGDGTNDDQPAIQAAIDYLVRVGGTLTVPRGNYKCGAELLIDYSLNTSESTLTKLSIRGDGVGASQLLFTGAGSQGIRLRGGTVGGLSSYQKIEGLRLQGNGGAFNGLTLDNLAFFHMEDVLITGFGNYGVFSTDLLSTLVENVFIRANKYGFYCERIDQSYPNAIAWVNVDLGLNSEYGAYFKRPTTLTVTGGSIQGSGNGGVGADRWGIKIDSAGGEGAAGVTFDGTYFEFNENRADVWIDHSVNSATYSFDGCTFNRIDASKFVTNNIRCDVGGGKVKLVTKGCGYAGFNTYVEDVARKYVTLNRSGGASTFCDFGNLYNSAVAKPAISGPVRGDVAGASAYIRFNGSTGVTSQSFNATLLKNGTGDYTLTYDIAMSSATNIYSFTLATSGFLEIFSESVNNVRFITKNPAGTPTDFAAIGFVVHGGSDVV